MNDSAEHVEAGLGGRIRIYRGDNHSSWDEGGWIWFMAARDDAYCVVRITPQEYASLKAVAPGFSEFLDAVERRAEVTTPRRDDVYNQVFDIGVQPEPRPGELMLDWLATLYFIDPAEGEAAKSQWQASGTARAMVKKALAWEEERFRGAYLMGNAGLLYGPELLRQIADLHGIEGSSGQQGDRSITGEMYGA